RYVRYFIKGLGLRLLPSGRIIELLRQQSPITTGPQPLPDIHEVRIHSDQYPRLSLPNTFEDFCRRNFRVSPCDPLEARHTLIVQTCLGSISALRAFRD